MVNRNEHTDNKNRVSKNFKIYQRKNMDQIDKMMGKFNGKLESTKQNQMENLELKTAKQNI